MSEREKGEEPEATGLSGLSDEEWALSGEPHSLVDLVNRVLDRGVVAHGDVTISVAGVDLVYLGLNALLTSVSTARRTLGERVGTGREALPPPASPTAAGSGAGPVPERYARGDRGQSVDFSDTRVEGGEPVSAELVSLTRGLPERLEIDPDGVQRDLARLVLTLVELLRRVVEHQAVQRMDDGDLSDEQVERMGNALHALEEKLREIKRVFGLADDELNIDLGPLGKLL